MPTSPSVRRRFGSFAVAVALLALQLTPVVAAEITTDLWVYQTGDTVTVTGVDYAPDETVEIVTTDPYGAEVDRGTAQTDLYGGFTYGFVLTSDVPGIYDVVGTGLSSGLSAATQFDPSVESFTFTNPSASVQYSDTVTFAGTIQCAVSKNDTVCADRNAASSNQLTISIEIDPDGGGFSGTAVKTVSNIDVDYNTGAPGNSCNPPTGSGNPPPNICSIPWSFTWQSGRNAATGVVAPGTYDVRAVITGAGVAGGASPVPGTNGHDAGVVVLKEATTTTYTGSTSGTTGTALALSAHVTDLDGGIGGGNGVFSPDANLVGANVVTFQLRNSADSANVGAAVTASLDSFGNTTGSPSLTLPAPGPYKLRTSYATNTYYLASGPTVTDITSNPVDTTDPVVTITTDAADTVAGSGWYNIATSGTDGVLIHVAASDPSGVTNISCVDNGSTTVLNTASNPGSFALGNGTHSIVCNATDGVGNTGHGAGSTAMPVLYSIDQVAPAVTVTPARGPDFGGWYNAAVVFDTAGTDATSGVSDANCTADYNYTGPDGTSLTRNGSCTDNAGNVGNGTSSAFNFDDTNPAVTVTPARGPDFGGWYNAAVVFDTAGTDATSGVSDANCTADYNYTGPDGTSLTRNGSCTDNAGNVGNGTSSAFNFDDTNPAVTVTPARGPDFGGWYNAAVVFDTAGTDATSGVSDANCTADYNYTGPDGTSLTRNGSCTDNAGNVGNGTSSAFNFDDTNPNVLVTPDRIPDHNGWYNAPVTFDTSGTDVTSGLSDSNCSVDYLWTTPDGTDQTQGGSCTDDAGNVGIGWSDPFDFDDTDPAVSISTSAIPDVSGWYSIALSGTSGITVDVFTSDVLGVVSLTCTDDTGSGPEDVGDLDSGGDSFVVGDGIHDIECRVADDADNSGTDLATFKVDQTAPSISVALDRAPSGSGWFNLATGAPIAKFTCSDGTSGIFSCPADYPFPEGENQSHSGTAYDNAGNSASDSVSNVDVDLTAPSISVALDRAPSGSGWFNLATGAPIAKFTCSDGTSGIFSCPADYPFPEGENQSHSGTAYDNAGNSASDSVSNVDVDLTAPSISVALDRAPSGSGWFNLATGAPIAKFTCSDGTSGIFSCPADYPFPEGENQSHSGTAYDNAGNSASDSVSNVDVDLTAPSISVALDRAPSGSGWFNLATGAPIAKFTCSDGTSGIFSCPADYPFPEGENQSHSGTAYDNAGNSASDSVSNVDVDLTAPSISVALDRAPSGSGWFNLATGAPIAKFTCSDGTSGIFSCPADYPFPEGENQSHSGTAYDNAGNSASDSVSNVDVDLTAPSVTVMPARPPDLSGWYNAPVVFDTAGTDVTSGVQDANCTADYNYTGPDGNPLTRGGSCTDDAGNVGNGTSAAFKFDDTNPTASITFPASGGWYIESTWDAGCSTAMGDLCGTAADPLNAPNTAASGVDHTIASLRNDVTGKYWNWTTMAFSEMSENAAALTNVGGAAWSKAFAYGNFPSSNSYTVHAIAYDVAGNSGGANSTFTLDRYTIDYQQPLDDSILPAIVKNTGKYGRVVPVKVLIYKDGILQNSSNFALGDTFTIGVNHMTSCAAGATDGIESYADAGASNGNTNLFRWADGQLIYNLDTRAPAGVPMVIGQCYRLDVYLNGAKLSYARTAVFQPTK